MNIKKPPRVNENGVAVARYTVNMHDGVWEFEVVVNMHEVARLLSYRASKSKVKRATVLGRAVTLTLVGAPGHSDDCPRQKGGECVFPCHMQPTDNRRRKR